jgi:hypothetical protein
MGHHLFNLLSIPPVHFGTVPRSLREKWGDQFGSRTLYAREEIVSHTFLDLLLSLDITVEMF